MVAGAMMDMSVVRASSNDSSSSIPSPPRAWEEREEEEEEVPEGEEEDGERAHRRPGRDGKIKRTRWPRRRRKRRWWRFLVELSSLTLQSVHSSLYLCHPVVMELSFTSNSTIPQTSLKRILQTI